MEHSPDVSADKAVSATKQRSKSRHKSASELVSLSASTRTDSAQPGVVAESKSRSKSVTATKAAVAPASSTPAVAATSVAPKKSRVTARPVKPVSETAAPVRSTAIKPRTTRPKVVSAKLIQGALTGETVAHSEAEILQMIAVAAYFLAEKRQFSPGEDLHDWLLAEQQIRTQYQRA